MYEDDIFEEEDMENFICLDCGVNTADIGEYYMLTNEVWREAAPDEGELGGMLCVNCVELRLGRQLWPEDFMDAPLNYMHSMLSPRLLARFCGIPDLEAEELQELLKNNKQIAARVIGEMRKQNLKGPNKP